MAYTTIDKSSLHFNTKLYTGNGGNQTITGVGFQPDWVWFKARDAAQSHALVDIVRGTDKVLFSESVSAQGTISSQTFNSDGFALVQDGTANSINSSGSTKVAWSWKAGGGQGSSNTDGSINTTYTSVNTTSGFSVSQYTGNGVIGATVGHGLGAIPKMIIVKKLGGATDWMVYHEGIGNDHRLRLNTTAAKQDNPVWNDTTPTSSVFSMNDNGDANASGGTYVAYAFSEKRGFSSINSYVGNGSTDGTFVYTGFKPAFVLVKNTAIADNWSIFDNKRIGYNAFNYVLYADITNVGSNGLPMDILSNGFKWRTSAAMVNGSGQNHIYMAFAEAPIVGSNNVPANAR
jgi:hypothetical protein